MQTAAAGEILQTAVFNCPVEEVRFEQRVRVTFEAQDGIFYPLFERVT